MGEIEVDEPYFDAKRGRGNEGRGASGKTVGFGFFKRNGHVYTESVLDWRESALQAIICGRPELGSVVYSDDWRGNNGLVDVGYCKHIRVDHGQDEFVRGVTLSNGIEGIWDIAKSSLTRFRGMNIHTLYLDLKECGF